MTDARARDGLLEDVRVLEGMVNELLETERLDRAPGSVVREPVDLPALVRAQAGIIAPGRHVISLEGDDPPPVTGDRARLETVFRNIIENAVKFSPADGAPISIEISHGAAAVTVRVRDHGEGIAQEDVPYIFEPFYRADRARSHARAGYGLGLYLCKRIVEAHGGTIEARSVPGEGTTISVRVPVG